MVDLDPGVEVGRRAAPRARAGRGAERDGPAPAGARRGARPPPGRRCAGRTASSTARTDRPSVTIRWARASWKARSGVVSRARAWPAVSRPSATRRWTVGGSWNRRRVFEMAARLLPTAGGQLVVGEVEVLDELLVGGGLVQGVEVLALEVLDQRLLERRGVVDGADDGRDRWAARPAWPPASAARRRSARRCPPPVARTSTGCSTPSSRTEAVRAARASSSKCVRGWR